MDSSLKNLLKSLLGKFKKKCDETYVKKNDPESSVTIKNLAVQNKVKSNLTPDVNDNFNLGSSVKAWKSAYLAGDGLKFQSTKVDAEGKPLNAKIIALSGDDNVEIYYPLTVCNAIEIQSGKFKQYYPPHFDGSLNRLGAEAVNIVDGDIRFLYSDGSKAIDIKSNNTIQDGYFQIFYPRKDANGNSISAMEVTPDGKVVFNGLYHNGTVNEGMIVNPSNCHLEFGSDATDEIATENPLIIIPDIPSIIDTGNTLSPSDYNRIKIGGWEVIKNDESGNPVTEDVIFAYKQANDPSGTIPKFCITKAGDVYYNGMMLDYFQVFKHITKFHFSGYSDFVVIWYSTLRTPANIDRYPRLCKELSPNGNYCPIIPVNLQKESCSPAVNKCIFTQDFIDAYFFGEDMGQHNEYIPKDSILDIEDNVYGL